MAAESGTRFFQDVPAAVIDTNGFSFTNYMYYDVTAVIVLHIAL